MTKLMVKLLGANWKTTVSGVGAAVADGLTMLAGLSYTLGDVATIIPPYWKPKIFAVSFIAAFIMRVWNSRSQKDKSVTGGVVQQTADNKVADPVELGGVSQSVADTIKAEPKE
jgi:hypothetical protein